MIPIAFYSCGENIALMVVEFPDILIPFVFFSTRSSLCALEDDVGSTASSDNRTRANVMELEL